MATSIVYPGLTGIQTDFAIPFEYLSRDHVKVTLDGVATTSFDFLSTSMIQMDTAPSGELRVYRETPIDESLVTWNDGSILLDDDLNLGNLQTLFVAEELKEAAMSFGSDGHWDATNLRLKNVLDPTDSQDAVTLGYLTNTFLTQINAALANAEAARDAAQASASSASTDSATAQTARSESETAKDLSEDYRDEALGFRNQAETFKDQAESAAASFDLQNLDAANITQGVLDEARVPNLPASKINSGVLGAAQIPNLDTSKITTGVFGDGRFPGYFRSACVQISDWDTATTNGYYMSLDGANNPNSVSGLTGWCMGHVVAHNTLWVEQEVTYFTASAPANPQTYRRNKMGGPWSSWYQVVTSRDEIPFNWEYTSPDSAWVTGATNTFAHGLGVKPKMVQVILRATSALGDIAAGSDVFVGHDTNIYSAVWADATNVYFRSHPNGFRLVTSSEAFANASNSNAIVRAWR